VVVVVVGSSVVVVVVVGSSVVVVVVVGSSVVVVVVVGSSVVVVVVVGSSVVVVVPPAPVHVCTEYILEFCVGASLGAFGQLQFGGQVVPVGVQEY
jgi:hypothetical protein